MSNTKTTRPAWVVGALCAAVWLAPAACSSKDCVTLCEEAQAGGCTAIEGDCGRFCSALDSVQAPAGCEGQRERYEDCLNEGAVCDNSCGVEENALSFCVGAYCQGNSSNADCQTLLASFDVP
jgi:hypothetical protein